MTAKASLLPNPSALEAEPLTVAVGDVAVTFNFRPLSGRRYFQIIREHTPDQGQATPEQADAMSIQIMTEGIASVYSSVESTPVDFTPDMATEIWETWDQWARTKITNTIVHRVTRGVDSDPKAG